MNKKIKKYGVKVVARPKIKATKNLDLSGVVGKQIIVSETKLTLSTHKKTFDNPAAM